jgi:hypothetical protein
MFDELSAMGRTVYDNFGDLIRFGVVERDSHPAGIQVFLYYWSGLFGESEQLIKLPFLLAGMASIWVTYRIGELWFGRTAGMLSAAFISSLQLFVMYSQIARPYVSGLFFTLMMVLYWSKYFFIKPKRSYLVWFVVFASLASYNHYFSLLFAATVGFSGLLLVNRKTILPYIFSGFAIVILYLPHLHIIFAQAEKGTIGGWLGEPGPYFLFGFLYWLFHKSYVAIGFLVLIFILGIVFGVRKRNNHELLKRRLVLFLWLLPAPVFGYVYSYSIEPILQYSLLIFSTPYFLLLLFSFTGQIEFKKLSVLVLLILIVNSLTLIYVRGYYRIFYKQPFEQVVKEAVELDGDYPDEVFIINDYVPYFSAYYFRKYDKDIPYFSVRNKGLSIGQFDSVIRNIDQNIVILSGLDNNYFQIIKEQFPYWIGYDHGFTFEHYILSKIKIEGVQVLKPEKLAFTDFKQNEGGNWTYSVNYIIFDTVSNCPVFKMSSENEWGPKIVFQIDSISETGHIIIDIALELYPLDERNNILVVAEIKRDNEQLSWRAFNTGDFNLKDGEWQKVFFSLDIQDELGKRLNEERTRVEIYLWNKNKNTFLIKEIEFTLRPGNPDRYAL